MMFQQTFRHLSLLILDHIPQLAWLVVFLLFFQLKRFWPIWPLFCVLCPFNDLFVTKSYPGGDFFSLQYMQELLAQGQFFEFFIEGGRTRTGKALYPKGGLLSVIVDCYLDGKVLTTYPRTSPAQPTQDNTFLH